MQHVAENSRNTERNSFFFEIVDMIWVRPHYIIRSLTQIDSRQIWSQSHSGRTTEYYWKDYQLLGLYNLEGYRNGAPYYKRFKNAFLLGEIYFGYSPYGDWVVSDKSSFDENEGAGWLWKESPGCLNSVKVQPVD